ncbi:MAG: Ig domain-containing protein [Lachnospiraceae bacterium]
MKERMRKGILFVALLLMAVVFAEIPCEAASGAKISKTKANLFVGETVQLKVTGGSGTVKWKTSDKKIASVSKDGLVTAKEIGTCTITATKGSKKLTCNIEVTELPENYATINGKRVKVGKTLKFTYYLQSKKPICMISIKYKYDYDALKIVNEEENSRYPNWLNNEYIPRFIDEDKSVCDLVHLVGVDPKDPYSFADLSCSNKKVMEVMKVKALKSGNYTIKMDVYSVINLAGKDITGYKITKTVK